VLVRLDRVADKAGQFRETIPKLRFINSEYTSDESWQHLPDRRLETPRGRAVRQVAALVLVRFDYVCQQSLVGAGAVLSQIAFKGHRFAPLRHRLLRIVVRVS
jgi:hypothetical protein